MNKDDDKITRAEVYAEEDAERMEREIDEMEARDNGGTLEDRYDALRYHLDVLAERMRDAENDSTRFLREPNLVGVAEAVGDLLRTYARMEGHSSSAEQAAYNWMTYELGRGFSAPLRRTTNDLEEWTRYRIEPV